MSANTRPPVSPLPRQVNTATTVLDTTHGRILCIADIRGRLSALNDLARDANAKAIIHTGDFGFFDASSLQGNTINDRTLRHLTMYSPLIPSAQRTHLLSPENTPATIRSTLSISLLSEFPLLLSGQLKLAVPVYTVWGACEDVRILENFRTGSYNIDNLHVIDEATTRLLDVGGVKLRLLGLGGAVVSHKMFDCGDGKATIAGGQGTMWTTALQIGELVDTAQRVFDPSETRVLVTHASPGREGLIAQLALAVKADLTISAGLHFRYATSYNEFSVQGDYEGFRQKLVLGKAAFDRVWEGVKVQVEAVMDAQQKVLMDKALSVVERVPPELGVGVQAGHGEEPAWKNCWNWNLCDAAYGTLVLDVREGRVSAELKSQGFNYAYRRTPHGPTGGAQSTNTNQQQQQQQGTPTANTNASLPPPTSKAPTPAPAAPAPATPAPSGTPEKSGSGADTKAEREKAKKKEKKERKAAEKAAEKGDKPVEGKDTHTHTHTPRSSAATPTLQQQQQQQEGIAADPASTSDAQQPQPQAPKSPTTTNLTSPSTPSTTTNTNPNPNTTTNTNPNPNPNKKHRNPWTIFIRIPPPASSTPLHEKDIRALFPPALESQIIKVHLPTTYPGRARVVYVEFGSEEGMRRGLGVGEGGCRRSMRIFVRKDGKEGDEKGEEVEVGIDVKQALERGERGYGHGQQQSLEKERGNGQQGQGQGQEKVGSPQGQGRGGRGRGGGAYAARGFAAAGLTGSGSGRGRGGHHHAGSGGGEAQAQEKEKESA